LEKRRALGNFFLKLGSLKFQFKSAEMGISKRFQRRKIWSNLNFLFMRNRLLASAFWQEASSLNHAPPHLLTALDIIGRILIYIFILSYSSFAPR
jgi:hypothetical protein